MEHRILISGFGGQGVLFVGKVIAQAAVTEGREATWLPSYGPEMRGGTANCRIVISDEEIGSPAFNTSDLLIAMNVPSLTKFEGACRGDIITDERFKEYCVESDKMTGVDTSLCNGGEEFDGLTNMLMLGAMLKKCGIVKLESVKTAIRMMTKPNIAEHDIKAVEYGLNNVT